MLSDHHEYRPVEQVPTPSKWPLGIDDPQARAFLSTLCLWTLVLKFGYEGSLIVGSVLARDASSFLLIWLSCDLTVWIPLSIYWHRTKSSGKSRFFTTGVAFVLGLWLIKTILHVEILYRLLFLSNSPDVPASA